MMISMARGRVMLLTGVSLLVIFHLCQAQTSPATDPATTDPATTDPATTDPATTDPTTTDPATTDPATTEPATTEPATTDPATTEGIATMTVMDITTANVLTTKNSQTTVGIAATTMNRTTASTTNVPTTKDSQTTAITDQTTKEVMSMNLTNSTTPDNTTATTEAVNTVGITVGIAVVIILGFMLCTFFCLCLLSDWSCTQPNSKAAGRQRCCSCSCFHCFSRQDFANSSAFSPARSESHEVLDMEMTRVTEVGSFTNTSTLHWAGNHHSFHKYMAPQNLNNDEATSPSTNEDREEEDRGNNFRGVIAMLSDDRNAGRSKKFSEAINLDIFQPGEDETGRDSPIGDEVSDISNHTQMTVVSIHAPEHNERPSSNSDNSEGQQGGAGATGGHHELTKEWTVPKKSQERKKGFYMSDSEVSEDNKSRSYSQNVAEAMRTFDSTIQYKEEEERKDSLMTTEL
ncbi:uncharacterized protein LOC144911992 isoform X1 [Branchiostoma floridae x Branchiostoma belcheri]